GPRPVIELRLLPDRTVAATRWTLTGRTTEEVWLVVDAVLDQLESLAETMGFRYRPSQASREPTESGAGELPPDDAAPLRARRHGTTCPRARARPVLLSARGLARVAAELRARSEVAAALGALAGHRQGLTTVGAEAPGPHRSAVGAGHTAGRSCGHRHRRR